MMAVLFEIWTSFVGSSLIHSLVSAFAGAAVGAYAADRIASKKEATRRLLEEFDAVLKAIGMTTATINTAAVMRHQNLDGLLEKYRTQRDELVAALKRHERTEARVKFVVPVDLEVLPKLTTPINELKELIYSRVRLTGHDLHLVTPLVQSVTDLNYFIVMRKELAERFQREEWKNEKDRVFAYYGLKNDAGDTDGYVRGNLTGLETHANGILAFGRLLHDVLVGRAKELREELKQKDLAIPSIDFEQMEQIIEFPDMSEYEQWRTGEPG